MLAVAVALTLIASKASTQVLTMPKQMYDEQVEKYKAARSKGARANGNKATPLRNRLTSPSPVPSPRI